MKKNLLISVITAMLFIGASVHAATVPWDRPAVGRINPLNTLDTVFGNQFVATSTTATSSFPIASSTRFCLSSDCRTVWPAGSTPPGSNTQVIFNDAGAFGANANFAYDKTASALLVPNVQSPFGTTLKLGGNSNTGSLVLDTSGYITATPLTGGKFVLTDPSTFNSLNFDTSLLTIDRTATFPNKSGTFAYLSDIFWSRNSGSGFVYPATLTDSVGIGTSTPVAPLTVVASSTVNSAFRVMGNINGFLEGNIQNLSNAANASSDWVATSNNGDDTNHYVDMGINGSGGGAAPFTGANQGYLYSATDDLNLGALGATSTLKFYTTGGTSAVERARIDSAGNFLIGTSTANGLLTVAGTTTSPCFSNNGTTCITSGGGGTPGGSTTQLQYNNAGAFAGASGITTNGTTLTVTNSSTTAFAVGQNGATNPAFVVDASAATSIAGLSVASRAVNGGVNLSVISTSANEPMFISSKGSGNATLTSGSAFGNAVLATNNGNNRLTVTDTRIFISNASVSSGTTPKFNIVIANDTAITASTEAPAFWFDGTATRQHATGALPLQRDFRVSGTTHSFVGASTLSQAAAFAVDGPDSAGTNATITNSSAIYVPTSAVSAGVTNSFGLQITAATGATNNYAASTSGRFVMNNLTTSASTQGSALCGTLATGGEVIAESVSCLASAARYKTDIASTTFSIDGLMQLTPISFDWKKSFLNGNTDPNQTGTQYSLVADDVQKVFPQLVAVTSATTTFEGKEYAAGSVQGLADVNHWVSAIVSWLQQIVHRQDTMQSQIDAQQKEIDALKAEINHKK